MVVPRKEPEGLQASCALALAHRRQPLTSRGVTLPEGPYLGEYVVARVDGGLDVFLVSYSGGRQRVDAGNARGAGPADAEDAAAEPPSEAFEDGGRQPRRRGHAGGGREGPVTSLPEDLEFLEAAVQDHPDRRRGLGSQLGAAYSDADQDELARGGLSAGDPLRTRPTTRPGSALANSLGACGDREGAVSAGAQERPASPRTTPNTQALLGFQLLLTGRPREALAPLGEAVRLGPDLVA